MIEKHVLIPMSENSDDVVVVVVVVLFLFYVHGKHLRICRDGHFSGQA